MNENGIVELNLLNFGCVYLLLIIVLYIMKKCKINQTKLLLIASARMTIQLILCGLILTYIFKNPHPIFVILYLLVMTTFAIHTTIARNKKINKKFKYIAGLSLSITGIVMVIFFITIVVNVNFFNPQYTIPISGMIIGNAMTGVSLGIKTFYQNVFEARNKIMTLLNIGVHPKKILNPIMNNAVETALIPTLNTMLGMGVISLPGMMTGQILSGTMPTTAILYQIAIIVVICVVTCLSVFSTLYFGSRTMYNKRCQITFQ